MTPTLKYIQIIVQYNEIQNTISPTLLAKDMLSNTE